MRKESSRVGRTLRISGLSSKLTIAFSVVYSYSHCWAALRDIKRVPVWGRIVVAKYVVQAKAWLQLGAAKGSIRG